MIGAGLGGLAVAARLGAAGHGVSVLERSSEIGGKLGRFERDGFGFDTGPSLLTLPAVYRDLFRTTGRPLEQALELVPVDPVCHYRFADGLELDIPNASAHRMSQAWDEALGAGAGADWAAFTARAAQIWTVTRGPFLESPLTGRRNLLSLARDQRALRTIAPWRSLRDLGRRVPAAPATADVPGPVRHLYGFRSAPGSGRACVDPLPGAGFGAWHVRGGLHQLAAALAVRARARRHPPDGRGVVDIIARERPSARRPTGRR